MLRRNKRSDSTAFPRSGYEVKGDCLRTACSNWRGADCVQGAIRQTVMSFGDDSWDTVSSAEEAENSEADIVLQGSFCPRVFAGEDPLPGPVVYRLESHDVSPDRIAYAQRALAEYSKEIFSKTTAIIFNNPQ